MKIDACDLCSLSPEEAGHKLETLLPPVRELPTLSEVDYYGAADVIAERVGLPMTPATIPGTVSWHHGPARPPLWGLGDPDPPIPASEMDYPFHMAPKGAVRLLVHRKEEAFLESLGSVAHLAVGAPFCYVQSASLPRIGGTLLAMPSHSFVGGVSNHQLVLVDRYATYLEGLRKAFPFVCVCLYADDYADSNVRELYRCRGLPVVRGAGIKDRNSLRRMRRLFETFDCMTSNDFGSHVIYAAAVGCRPFVSEHSLVGEKRAIWEKHPFYANRPNVLRNVLKWNDPEFLRDRWPWLYSGKPPAVANTAWANEMLGMGNTRSPLEIARLLGWRYPFGEEPSREIFLKFAPLLGDSFAQHSHSPATIPSPWLHGFTKRFGQCARAVRRILLTARRGLVGHH